jgi:heme-degrading monooxygenase HmoA
MFARRVSMQVKPNSSAALTERMEKNILPLLRKQAGFKDEITFLAPAGNEAVAISLWESKENAEAYGRDTYPAVLRTLERVVEGTPEVDSYEVSNSTFHKIASRNPNQSQPVTR